MHALIWIEPRRRSRNQGHRWHQPLQRRDERQAQIHMHCTLCSRCRAEQGWRPRNSFCFCSCFKKERDHLWKRKKSDDGLRVRWLACSYRWRFQEWLEFGTDSFFSNESLKFVASFWSAVFEKKKKEFIRKARAYSKSESAVSRGIDDACSTCMQHGVKKTNIFFKGWIYWKMTRDLLFDGFIQHVEDTAHKVKTTGHKHVHLISLCLCVHNRQA